MSVYVKIRETIAGTEYWNKETKRTEIFAPGTAPDNIQTEGMVGLYSASGKVATVVTEPDTPAEPIIMFADMTIKELRAYATEHEITIPSNIKAQKDIVNYLNEVTMNDGELVDDEE